MPPPTGPVLLSSQASRQCLPSGTASPLSPSPAPVPFTFLCGLWVPSSVSRRPRPCAFGRASMGFVNAASWRGFEIASAGLAIIVNAMVFTPSPAVLPSFSSGESSGPPAIGPFPAVQGQEASRDPSLCGNELHRPGYAQVVNGAIGRFLLVPVPSVGHDPDTTPACAHCPTSDIMAIRLSLLSKGVGSANCWLGCLPSRHLTNPLVPVLRPVETLRFYSSPFQEYIGQGSKGGISASAAHFAVAFRLLSSAKSPSSQFASVSWPRGAMTTEKRETDGWGKHDTDLTSNPIRQDQQGLALSGSSYPPSNAHTLPSPSVLM